MSPTARTLAAFRKAGYRAGVVERWIAPARRRVDLYGFIDGISLTPGHIIGWQACTGSGLSEHLHKITTECREAAVDWLESRGQIEVWAWRKLSPRGTKQKRWKAIVVGLMLGQDGRIVEAYRKG